MPEVYDTEYEAMRLSQLTEQCVLASDIDGKVIFRSSPDENQLEITTWVFSDDHYARLKDSSYKSMLLPLIDSLITYRTRCGMQNCREGYVALSKSKATIIWLPDGEGETLAAAYQATESRK